jgi:translocation and assembly module TamB
MRKRYHALIATTTLIGVAVIVIAWIVMTSGGATLVLERAASMVGQGAKVSGVEGSLSGTLRIKSIDITRPDLIVRIRDVELERASGGPWLGRAVFRKFNAESVEVRTASTGAAARVPVAFHAPYPLRVESGRVGELRLGAIVKDGKPPPDLVLRELRVTGEGDERAWKLDSASAQTPWGNVNLAGTLATTTPFAIDLAGDLAGEREDLRYRITARLGGTLQRIEAKFDAEERDLRANGTAILEPFASQPLRALKLTTRDVDLGKFANLPHTRLAMEAALEPVGKGFGGPIRIVNAEPGPLDRGRVPVASANGRLLLTREGEANQVELSDAQLAIAGGGSAQGRARWRPGRVEAQWRIADVDPAQWHTRMRPTKVSGTLSAVGEGDSQRFEVALSDPRFAIEGAATLKASRLDVESARVKHASGLVEGKGFIALAQRREFRFEGRAQHFDPAVFVNDLKGDLNFDFVASGALEPALSGDLRLELAQSRLSDLPATGTIRIAGDAKRISNADVRVALGDSRVQAKGAFGRPGDAMDVAIQSPNLSTIAKPLGLALAGKVDAKGTLTGTFAAPGGRFELTGSNVAMPGGFYAATLGGRGDISSDAQGRVDATLEAKNLTRRTGDAIRSLAERATVEVHGTRAAHRANIVGALSKEAEFNAAFEGGLDAREPRLAWKGRVLSLALTGPSAFTLVAPASLIAATDRVEIGDATLKAAWGEARFATTRWTPSLIELRGSSPGIALRNAARAFRLTTVPRGSLAVAAEWDIRAAQTVDGFVSVTRTAGDLRIGDPPQPLGLDELKLRVESRQGKARATVSLHGQRIGRVNGDVTGTLQRTGAGLSIAQNAPIEGRVDAEMDSLGWMAAWMGPEAKADGRLNAHLVISGTAADPRWNGQVVGENISLREPQTGFEAEKGVLSLRLRDRAVVVEKLTASTPWNPPAEAAKALQGASKPAAGTLSAEGAVDLGARTGAITIKAVSVPVTQLSTRFLALTGEAKLEARNDGLLATGALKADAGWIGALATALPSVSEDVVVRRAAVVEDRPRERMRMDVRFSLGEHVWFRGRGLNMRLRGDLRITGEPGAALRGTGSIRTAEGTYDAYGQQLRIEHGTLTFFGSLENPSLDVLALRKGLPVEAGVEVTGNVARPRARLVSLPDVPDPEKISWLVLGRGPGDVSQGEASTLVAAANAILGRTSPAGDIARRFGFDEVKIGRTDTASALGTLPQSTVAGKTGSASAAEVVTVGKRLTKDIYVVYEQGLADAEGALRITWQITQKMQVLLRAGYLPGVDAVYRWTFE